MRRWLIVGLVGVLAVIFTAETYAKQERQRKRSKDGSCLTADRSRKRDQKRIKDGSCLTADRSRKRQQKRLKDGSCKA